MFEELQERAKAKKAAVDNDVNSTEQDKKAAKDIVFFFSKENHFTQVPKSLIFGIFRYSDYPYDKKNYYRMYDAVIEDINRVYTLVDPEEGETQR